MICIKKYYFVNNINGDNMDYIKIIMRMSFFYVFIILIYRIMGKREVGQLGIIDLIVSILIAELVAISVEDLKVSILYSVIPIICLVVFEIVLSYISLKNTNIRNILEGKPVFIIKNGKIKYKEMIKNKYTLDDLLGELRQNSYRSIDEIEYAILENSGKLSIFPYNKLSLKSPLPLPIIIDGCIQYDTLKEMNKNVNYIDDILKKEKVEITDVFYAFIKNNSVYIIKKDYISRI